MKTKVAIRDTLKDVGQEPASGLQENILGTLVGVLQAARTDRTVLLVLGYEALERWREVDITSLPGLLPNDQFDLVENTKDAPFPEKHFDVVVVPLFGFNNGGYRLGHGGGWYDKFLATQPNALKIGVGYEDSLVEFKPDAHDIPMHIIITDKRVRFFRTS